MKKTAFIVIILCVVAIATQAAAFGGGSSAGRYRMSDAEREAFYNEFRQEWAATPWLAKIVVASSVLCIVLGNLLCLFFGFMDILHDWRKALYHRTCCHNSWLKWHVWYRLYPKDVK